MIAVGSPGAFTEVSAAVSIGVSAGVDGATDSEPRQAASRLGLRRARFADLYSPVGGRT
jgi:hypothetical protein